jgi:hypothetical protein
MNRSLRWMTRAALTAALLTAGGCAEDGPTAEQKPLPTPEQPTRPVEAPPKETPRPDAPPADAKPLDRVVLPEVDRAIDDLKLHTWCNETKARTPMGTVTWTAPADRFERQRLDITVFKQGFRQQMYTTLYPIEPRGKIAAVSAVKLPGRDGDANLFPAVVDVRRGPRDDACSVTLEGLEPGVGYFVRICTLTERGWQPSAVARGRAPICTADMKDGEGR